MEPERRSSPLYQIALVVVSVYVLIALCAEALFVTDPEIRQVLQYVDLAICIIFLTDFFVNLARAESKLGYLRWGWIDFVSSIPMVDPLRWGRLARVVRILRFLRALRSIRVIYETILASKIQSLTLFVFIFVFVSYTLSASLILEFEREHDSAINTAESALWWALLNVLNSKTSIDMAQSSGGTLVTMYLNQVGLVLFTYINATIVAWLIGSKRVPSG